VLNGASLVFYNALRLTGSIMFYNNKILEPDWSLRSCD